MKTPILNEATSIAAVLATIVFLEWSPDVQAGLVAHLTFDDPLDLGADSSGNGNDGAEHPPVLATTGITGGAADFTSGNGTLRWTGETNPVEDVLEDDFTFSVWVNTTATGGGAGSGLAYLGQGIVYADVSGNAPDTTPIALNGNQFASLSAGTGLLSSSAINTGQWVHLAVTRDFGGIDRIYVNGVEEDSDQSWAARDLSARNELVLGGNLVDSRYFNGSVDDFQVYNSALSGFQIAHLFNNPGTALESFNAYISKPTFGLDPEQQGFTQDPDGDELSNGLEAWFGTHPGEFNAPLANLVTDGTSTTFEHPQNEAAPAEVVGSYQWSSNLHDWFASGVTNPAGDSVTFTAVTADASTTVTAVANSAAERLYCRVVVELRP